MAKRFSDSKPIKKVIKDFIKENNLTDGFIQIRAKEAWQQVMGNGVQAYTTSVKLKNETLIIHLSSSVLREELSYGKDKIIKMMNEVLGETLIKKVRLT